jgi:hypothetical protein
MAGQQEYRDGETDHEGLQTDTLTRSAESEFRRWNSGWGGALPQDSSREDVMTTSLLISVLVTFLVIILILYLINLLPLDGRAKQIVRIIVIIIGVLSLLKYIAVF